MISVLQVCCESMCCVKKKKKTAKKIHLSTSNLSQIYVLIHLLGVVVCGTGMTLVRTIKKREELPHL